MNCLYCHNPLSKKQLWRRNKYCTKSCARKADWTRRKEGKEHCPGCRCFEQQPRQRNGLASPALVKKIFRT